MRLAVLVGNPKPNSRTRKVAEVVADRVAAACGATVDPTIDLCDYAHDLFCWPHDELAKLSDAVATADLVVVASPTFKAAYTGLLKAFLDRYPSGALSGVSAIPVMTAADPLHGLAVETSLRPLLVELGASVPTRGFFFLISQLPEIDQAVDDWAAANLSNGRPLAAKLDAVTTPK